MPEEAIIQDDIDLPDVTNAIKQLFDSRVKQYPVNSLWASKLGHPCERCLVLDQCEWRKKKKHGGKLEMLFDVGRLIGSAALRDLEDSLRHVPDYRHISVEQTEVPLPDNPHRIHGRLDCVLRIPYPTGQNVFVPVEIKSMNEHTFNKIEKLSDMLEAAQYYLRQYPAQLMMYMYLSECEWGLFLLRNKSSGEYKHIVTHLDLEYCEQLIQKADRVNAAADKYKALITANGDAESALPDRIFWTSTICGRCDFLHICIPDMSNVSGIADRLGDHELDDAIDIMLANDEQRKLYAAAEKRLKAHAKIVGEDLTKGQTKTLVTDNHEVVVQCVESTKYAYPDDVKKQFAKKYTYAKLADVK